MKSEILKKLLDDMKKDHWWVKFRRWLWVELYVLKRVQMSKGVDRKLEYIVFVGYIVFNVAVWIWIFIKTT